MKNPDRYPTIRQTTRYSYFSSRPNDFSPDKNYSIKIPLTVYCKKRNISKDQARSLINKRWLGITKFKKQVWVEEHCPELIQDYLGLP